MNVGLFSERKEVEWYCEVVPSQWSSVDARKNSLNTTSSQKSTAAHSWLQTYDTGILEAAGLLFLQIAGVMHQQGSASIPHFATPYTSPSSFLDPVLHHLAIIDSFPFLPFLTLLSCWCGHWSRLATWCICITFFHSLHFFLLFPSSCSYWPSAFIH